jgi:hypothetical protein
MQNVDARPLTQPLPWPGAHGMEHRFGNRLPCGTQVTVSAGAGVVGAGRMVNVSLSGAYVETAVDLPLFSPVAIEKLCGGGRGISLRACVVRKDADGVGIEWCETPSRSICVTLGCPRPCRTGAGD